MTNWQDLLFRFRWQIAILLVGFVLAGIGYFFYFQPEEPKIQVIETDSGGPHGSVTAEITGAVVNSGVYTLEAGSRIDDLINLSGGLSSDADINWVERYVNRAAILSDGQKLFIPSVNDQSTSASDNNGGGDQAGAGVLGAGENMPININTASQSELESLPGIGPVYAQKIIDNRPYSSPEELLTRDVLRSKLYEDIINHISVF